MSKFLYVVFVSLILISLVQAAEPFHLVLTDIEQDIYVENSDLKSSDLTPDSPVSWSVRKYTLHGDKQEGIDVIEVNNGKLNFTVIPTHGMSVLNMRMGDFNFGSNSSLKKLIHPKYFDLQNLRNLNRPEGVDEWIVRSGLKFPEKSPAESTKQKNMDLKLFGAVGITPASRVEIVIGREVPYSISIRGRVDQTGTDGAKLELWTEISTVPGANTFQISDKVTNQSDIEQEVGILYHVNFGLPLVDKGARFFGPMRRVVPIDKTSASNAGNYYLYDRTKIGLEEQTYCLMPWAGDEDQTEIMIHNSIADKAVSMAYSVDDLPFLTLWKKSLASDDGYVTSLEPATGFPLNRDIENKLGQARNLAPNQSRTFKIDFKFHTGREQVSIASSGVAKIWAGRQTRIDTGPQVGRKPSLKDIVAAARTWGPSFTKWYGKPAPDFALTDIEGKNHKLSDYKGRDVIIVLWATWCGPCRVEIPHLIELRKTIGEDKLAMLGISNENPGLVKRFAEQAKLNYTILLDRGTMPAPYSSVTGIPSSFFINSEGRIKIATTGLLSLDEIKAILDAE